MLRHLKDVTGKQTVAEIWPDLRLGISGGTAFGPYRELFRREIGEERVKFCGVYARRGRFAVERDADLVRANEDYAAHPVGDLTVQRPEVRVMKRGGSRRG